MENTLFENNSAHDAGAIFLVYGNVDAYINNSTFINNSATTQGGAIYMYSGGKPSIHLSNSTFINNTSPKGGAMLVYSTTAVIDNCTFTDNSADRAGALWLENGNNIVNNSYFEGNTALTNDGFGGAIVHYGDFELIVDNSSFVNNSAITGGGIYYYQSSASSAILNSNFTNNTADKGDGVYHARYPGKMENLILTDDVIEGSADYYAYDFNMDDISNVTVDGTDPYEFYRVVNNLPDNSVLVIPEDFDFSNGPLVIKANNVTVDGMGRTYSNASNSFLHIVGDNVVVKNITFVNGTANNGGAINWTGNNGLVVDSNFINNFATSSGAALYCTGKNMTIVNSTFYNNTGGYYLHGAVYYAASTKDFDQYTLKIFDSDFANNSGYEGGAIYMSSTAEGSVISNTTFNNNTALSGGAIFTLWSSSGVGFLDVNKSSFVHNTASNGLDGGSAIYIGSRYIVNINDCEFINNTGKDTIFSYNPDNVTGECNIRNSNFSGNNASRANINTALPGSISNVIITDNTGDGIWAQGSRLELDNVTVSNSTGTALQINANDVVLDNIEVSGNNGTAMVVNGDNIDLSGSTFVNNTGDTNVGVVINGKGASVANSTFANNTGTSGTGIVLNGEDTNVSGDNTFANNTAQYGASDINVLPGSGLSEDEYKDLMDQYPDADVGKAPVLDIAVNSTDGSWTVRIHDGVTITINITEGNQSGKVKVTIPGLYDEQVLDAVDGIINISLSDVPVGNYTAEIVYLKDDNYTSRIYSPVLTVREYSLNDLRQLIADAVANNQTDIDLDQNYIFQNGDSTDPIEIPDNFNINGNGHFIDAGNQSSIFEIIGDNVNISNMTLTGANGTAISGKGDNTKISDVNITDSTCDTAAIDIEGDNTIIDNVNIENIDGDAIVIDGDDAQISDVTISDVDDAIVIDGEGDVNIINVDITNAEGDAITVDADNVNIDNVNLTNVTNSVDIDAAGDISISNMNIENITNCPAFDVDAVGDINISDVDMYGVYGPAIEASTDNGTVTITNVTNYTIIPVEANMTVDMPEIVENTNTTIPVKLPDNATGNVTLEIDGETVDTQEVINGSAVLNVPELSEGEHNITVSYSGDIQYLPETQDFNVSVVEGIFVTADDLTKYYSATDKFVVNVTDTKGNPLFNKTVKITLNGKTYVRHTDENGSAFINVNLNSGEYEVVITADNLTLTRTVTILSTVNGSDIVKVFRNGTQYYATFRDGEGNYLPEGTQVTFIGC